MRLVLAPNIDIDIDVTDKIPFFIRPCHVKEEDKKILDKEMKRLHYLGILKEGFSAYSSPIMLISRKVMQDKSGDRLQAFEHQNWQKQLSLSINKGDTFATLGNSKCNVLLILDSKMHFTP